MDAAAPSLPSITDRRLRGVRAPFRQAVLVCGKCARKLDGEGFGRRGRQSLAKALKAELKSGLWGAKVRVVETSCLKLCPKRRQVVTAPHELAAGRLLVAEPGLPATAVLDRLLGPALAPPPDRD